MISLLRSRSLSLVFGATFLGVTAIPETTQSATMVWEAPELISGDTDVKTSGTLVAAYSFGDTLAGGTVATVNGVAFSEAYLNTSYTKLSTSGVRWGYGAFGGSPLTAPFSSLNASYRTLLSRGLYSNLPWGATVSLSGLTAGKTYLVQMWVNDSRGGSGNTGPSLHEQIFFSEGSESPELRPMQSVTTPGTVGTHITGYLTMGPGETTATITAETTSVAETVRLNAIQIREVEGKSAWMREAKYGIFVHYLPGTSTLSPAYVGGVSTLAQIISGLDSPWSQYINNFDVDTFADQAAESGAGYVIFANGQATGYYCSPNSTYEGAGPLKTGEFTSRRDLIYDLGVALQSRGIKLFVYMAGEGPLGSAPMTSQIGGSVNMANNTGASAGPAYSGTFRALFNSMIAEYSNRWGTLVSGWWFDACWDSTGYGSVSDNGQGLNNLNALIAAAKSGNPSALVACNPGVNNMAVLSANQDYAAGEMGFYTGLYDKFYLYPRSQFINYGGTDVQWHAVSFLGTNWTVANQKYTNEELISYISSVNSYGGVVTLDIAFSATGSIYSKQLDQLKAIKAALKPNVPPMVTHVPPAQFVNLALFKPAYFRSNSYGNIDGSDMIESMYLYKTHAGVDGDISTHAQAGGEYAYGFIVDLETSQAFDRVAVHMNPSLFATSYEIYYSTTGLAGSWQYLNTTQTTYSTGSGGLKVHDANGSKTGRYIKLKALAPYASGQTGSQMGVAEIEVYNTGGTASSAADTVWVDDKVPSGASLTTGGSGSWTWASLLDSGFNSSGLPYPKDGLKIHWSPTATGLNEHGFQGASAVMNVTSADTLYCWVWIDPAAPTTEILLRWTATDNTTASAYWGANNISGGGTYMGALPTAGTWTKLSVPVNTLGLASKSLNGMSYAVYDGKVVFDRAGKTR